MTLWLLFRIFVDILSKFIWFWLSLLSDFSYCLWFAWILFVHITLSVSHWGFCLSWKSQIAQKLIGFFGPIFLLFPNFNQTLRLFQSQISGKILSFLPLVCSSHNYSEETQSIKDELWLGYPNLQKPSQLFRGISSMVTLRLH